MKKVVLVSTSPRRIGLLEKHNFLSSQIDPEFDDSNITLKNDNDIKKIAKKKLDSVKRYFKNEILIACDTVVKINDMYIGKPRNRKDAKKMLEMLSDSVHFVVSYLVMYDGIHKKYHYKKVSTRVFFDKLTDKEMENYLDTNEYLDKAGGYAVQGKAAPFISKIEGDYYNIVGFPLNGFYRLLKEIV